MLVECANCGAPLKTKPNRKTFQCSYCDCVNRVAEVRTIAERDPRGWKPPAEWTPPAHVPAASVPLHYHGGGGVSRWVVAGAVLSAAVVVFALLGGRQQVNIAADGSCPASFAGLAAGTLHTCRCGAGMSAGTVWGTRVYTADSSICQAALHAGAVSSAGGEIQVLSAPGCDTYVGSTQNGVQTNAWGSYGASFYFPGHGQGTCAGLGSGTCPEQFSAIAANAKADGY